MLLNIGLDERSEWLCGSDSDDWRSRTSGSENGRNFVCLSHEVSVEASNDSKTINWSAETADSPPILIDKGKTTISRCFGVLVVIEKFIDVKDVEFHVSVA